MNCQGANGEPTSLRLTRVPNSINIGFANHCPMRRVTA